MQKKKLKLLIFYLFDNEILFNKFFFITSLKKKKIKQNTVLIFYGKDKFKVFLVYFFFLFFKRIIFEKNFFLIYKFKHVITGHKFFPNWPGIYFRQKIPQNLYLWFKKFFYIFFFLKNIKAIVLKII